MGAAQETQVLEAVVASATEGVVVVELEPVPGRAAPAFCVHVGAATFVALVDGAADGGGDVARGGPGVRGGEALPRGPGLPEPLRFESFELLGDGGVDDGSVPIFV